MLVIARCCAADRAPSSRASRPCSRGRCLPDRTARAVHRSRPVPGTCGGRRRTSRRRRRSRETQICHCRRPAVPHAQPAVLPPALRQAGLFAAACRVAEEDLAGHREYLVIGEAIQQRREEIAAPRACRCSAGPRCRFWRPRKPAFDPPPKPRFCSAARALGPAGNARARNSALPSVGAVIDDDDFIVRVPGERLEHGRQVLLQQVAAIPVGDHDAGPGGAGWSGRQACGSRLRTASARAATAKRQNSQPRTEQQARTAATGAAAKGTSRRFARAATHGSCRPAPAPAAAPSSPSASRAPRSIRCQLRAARVSSAWPRAFALAPWPPPVEQAHAFRQLLPLVRSRQAVFGFLRPLPSCPVLALQFAAPCLVAVAVCRAAACFFPVRLAIPTRAFCQARVAHSVERPNGCVPRVPRLPSEQVQHRPSRIGSQAWLASCCFEQCDVLFPLPQQIRRFRHIGERPHSAVTAVCEQIATKKCASCIRPAAASMRASAGQKVLAG